MKRSVSEVSGGLTNEPNTKRQRTGSSSFSEEVLEQGSIFQEPQIDKSIENISNIKNYKEYVVEANKYLENIKHQFSGNTIYWSKVFSAMCAKYKELTQKLSHINDQEDLYDRIKIANEKIIMQLKQLSQNFENKINEEQERKDPNSHEIITTYAELIKTNDLSLVQAFREPFYVQRSFSRVEKDFENYFQLINNLFEKYSVNQLVDKGIITVFNNMYDINNVNYFLSKTNSNDERRNLFISRYLRNENLDQLFYNKLNILNSEPSENIDFRAELNWLLIQKITDNKDFKDINLKGIFNLLQNISDKCLDSHLSYIMQYIEKKQRLIKKEYKHLYSQLYPFFEKLISDGKASEYVKNAYLLFLLHIQAHPHAILNYAKDYLSDNTLRSLGSNHVVNNALKSMFRNDLYNLVCPLNDDTVTKFLANNRSVNFKFNHYGMYDIINESGFAFSNAFYVRKIALILHVKEITEKLSMFFENNMSNIKFHYLNTEFLSLKERFSEDFVMLEGNSFNDKFEEKAKDFINKSHNLIERILGLQHNDLLEIILNSKTNKILQNDLTEIEVFYKEDLGNADFSSYKKDQNQKLDNVFNLISSFVNTQIGLLKERNLKKMAPHLQTVARNQALQNATQASAQPLLMVHPSVVQANNPIKVKKARDLAKVLCIIDAINALESYKDKLPDGYTKITISANLFDINQSVVKILEEFRNFVNPTESANVNYQQYLAFIQDLFYKTNQLVEKVFEENIKPESAEFKALQAVKASNSYKLTSAFSGQFGDNDFIQYFNNNYDEKIMPGHNLMAFLKPEIIGKLNNFTNKLKSNNPGLVVIENYSFSFGQLVAGLANRPSSYPGTNVRATSPNQIQQVNNTNVRRGNYRQ